MLHPKSKSNSKKNLIAFLFGVAICSGMFFWNCEASATGELTRKLEYPTATPSVKIADLSSIDWEIEVVEELEIAEF